MRSTRHFLSILCLLLASRSCLSCPSEYTGAVTIPPKPQNVTNGSRAVFVCEGFGHSLTWHINSSILNSVLVNKLNIEYEEIRNESLCRVNSTISVLGWGPTNNSLVSCTLLGSSGLNHKQSEGVLLRVQGPPGAVGDLETHYDEQSRYTVSWSAPSTLLGVETIYYVSVTDESIEGQSVVKAVSGTSYIVEDLTPCHRYNISVTSSNDAGNGSLSSFEYFYPGAPVSPTVDNITITSLALNEINGLVVTTLQYPVTSKCYSDQNITIKATTSVNGSVLSSVSQVDENLVTVAIDGIPVNKVLLMSLVLSNEFGTVPVSKEIMLRTYNTQGVAITLNHTNGTSCFQCVFLANSRTSGCMLKLNPAVGHSTNRCSQKRSITLPRNGNCSVSEQCFNNIYRGIYNIEVYDLYNNGNGTSNSDALSIDHRQQSQPQVLTNIGIEGIDCSVKANSERPTATSTVDVSSTSMISPFVTVGPIENSVGDIRTAVVLIGVFGGVLVIILLVMMAIFIYRKRQMKGGSLTINRTAASVDDTDVTRVQTIQGDEISQMPSFTSLGPPPYQPPPQITKEDLDQHPTEQYIIMHSASTRSPSVSNSTSSHLGLVHTGATSSSQKDLNHGHYDHLQQMDPEDYLPKKQSFDHLLKSNGDQYSFELKPYHRNEHLV